MAEVPMQATEHHPGYKESAHYATSLVSLECDNGI